MTLREKIHELYALLEGQKYLPVKSLHRFWYIAEEYADLELSRAKRTTFGVPPSGVLGVVSRPAPTELEAVPFIETNKIVGSRTYPCQGPFHSLTPLQNRDYSWFIDREKGKRVFLTLDGLNLWEIVGFPAIETPSGPFVSFSCQRLSSPLAILQGVSAAELLDRDPKTLLYHSEKFKADLVSELNSLKAEQDRVAVLMFDIDHFKHINDMYGHIAADRVLQAFAGILKAESQGKGSAYRFGGEEFYLLLQVEEISGGIISAERVLGNISAISLDEIGENVTCSCGVTVAPDHGNDPDLLMRQADQALYRAKQQGRDCVVLFE